MVGVENLLPHSGHKDADGEGYANVLIKEAFKDYRLTFELAPYARLQRYLDQGQIDIILLSAKYDFDDAQPVIFPDQAIASSTMSFFVRFDNPWHYRALPADKDMVIGLVDGLVYPEIEAFLSTTKLNYYMSGDNITQRSLRLLLNGRISAFYEDRDAVLFAARTMGVLPRIREAGVGDPLLLMYPAFTSQRVDSVLLTRRFDEAMRTLRDTGQLAKILAQYHKEDWDLSFQP